MTTTVTVAVTGVGDGDDGGGDGKRARRHPCCGLEGQLVQGETDLGQKISAELRYVSATCLQRWGRDIWINNNDLTGTSLE